MIRPEPTRPPTDADMRVVRARNELERIRESAQGRVGDPTPWNRAIEQAEQALAEATEAQQAEQAAIMRAKTMIAGRVTALTDISWGNGKRSRAAAGEAIPEGVLPEEALQRLAASGQVYIDHPLPKPAPPRFVVAGRLALGTDRRGIIPPGAGIEPADFKRPRRFEEHFAAGRIIDNQPDPEPPLAA